MLNLSNADKKPSAKLEVLTPDLASKINAVIEKYNKDSSRLISILLETQDIIPNQFIPTEVATYISEYLNLPLSRVYDVISFYAALSSKERAKYIIQVCDSVVCKVVGNTSLVDTLEELLGIKMNEITSDRKFALEYTPCFGACDIAPAIRLNGRVYGNLNTYDRIKGLIERCNEGGKENE